MIRTILFLVVVGALALGAAWVADQSGNITLVLNGWRIETSLPVFAAALVAIVVAAMLIWAVIRGIWRLPRRLKYAHRTRRELRGRHAITHGLIAIGTGDHRAARRHAQIARRHATHDPLALLLHAQEAQLSGDRAGAERAFETMAAREDTRLLGLRGLFVEAQRNDDPVRAVAIAEATLKAAPNSAWASQAVLGFRCAQGDWAGALAILGSNQKSGLIDAHAFRRQRAVLLTAQALEIENSDRDHSREIVNEAVKLAPTLVPAATLGAKFLSESHQARKAMRMIEVAWRAHPHPDLADAYAHVRLADSARERLTRIEALAQMTPEKDDARREAALAVARAAIDAREFTRAREALASFTASPTKRVAMLMAEIERADGGDSGRAREWTVRAVHARHDPVWTADGYVSDRWRPVSPVTGRIDAFQWTTPVAALPSDVPPAIEATPGASIPAIEKQRLPEARDGQQGSLPSADSGQLDAAAKPVVIESQPVPAETAGTTAETVQSGSASVPPLFRPRRDLGRAPVAPAVIPIIRAPDDPGVDDDEAEESVYEAGDETAQAGGWRGFLSRVRR